MGQEFKGEHSMGQENTDQEARVEELSALMDGEVSELELRRVMKNVQQDNDLSQKWARYQLCSSVMRKQTNGHASQWAQIDISQRVQQALAHEPAPQPIPVESKATPWLKPFTNVAVAASVSAAVILGWQNFGADSHSSAPQSLVSADSSLSPASSSPSPILANSRSTSPFTTVAQGGSGAPAAYRVAHEGEIIRYRVGNDKHINNYLFSHSGNAAMSTATGMEPYVREVSSQSQKAPVER